MKLAPAEKLIHVVQGEYAVAAGEASVMTALLGSCVAACLHDPVAGVGGMNHFLLPEPTTDLSDRAIYGLQAMELLINALLKLGAERGRLEAKLFGGGRMLAGRSDFGRSNGLFAVGFLRDEGIPCIAQSLGGTLARRIRFWPGSGRARQRLLSAASDVPVRVPAPRAASEVELF
jgi:chemotaxis protein CheD